MVFYLSTQHIEPGTARVLAISSNGKIISDIAIRKDAYSMKSYGLHISPGNKFLAVDVGFTESPDYGHLLPYIFMYDIYGKLLWENEFGFIDFLDNGRKILADDRVGGYSVPPCSVDTQSGQEYGCARVLDTKTGELVNLITIKGEISDLDPVTVLWDSLIMISGKAKNMEDNIEWETGNSYGQIDEIEKYEVGIFRWGSYGSVINKSGHVLWEGELVPVNQKLQGIPSYDFMISYPFMRNPPTILFWNEPWNYLGFYEPSFYEYDQIMYGGNLGSKVSKYKKIYYSKDGTATLGLTKDSKTIDYYKFE